MSVPAVVAVAAVVAAGVVDRAPRVRPNKDRRRNRSSHSRALPVSAECVRHNHPAIVRPASHVTRAPQRIRRPRRQPAEMVPRARVAAEAASAAASVADGAVGGRGVVEVKVISD